VFRAETIAKLSFHNVQNFDHFFSSLIIIINLFQMVLATHQTNVITEDDDDEDLETLRLAALKSLRKKDSVYKKSTLSQVQKVQPQVIQSSRFPYKNSWPTKKNFYNRIQQKQNGVSFYLRVIYD